ncbi:MAG TPA: M24 family metallopeptidase, partial [Candidatus Limiplasma sp.]|nr:M24 family metallopeptidase [Candidatus Limiplasma sp.]
MIYLKNAQQLDCMRKSGALLFEVLCRLKEAIKPGVSTAALDVYAEQLIRKHKAIPSFLNYEGYPASLCVSINEEVVHGIPTDQVLIREGDVVSIDCGLILDGWQADSAFTIGVGQIDFKKRQLIDVTEESFFKGVRQAING